MESKQQKEIQVKVISGRDLWSFNFFQKLLLYANVSVTGSDEKRVDQIASQRTPTDTQGDGNPEWNHDLHFDVPEDCDGLFLKFELRHEGLLFGDKTIGDVRVPLGDLIRESNGALRYVSYEVRSPDGKPNGVLNFSFKADCKVMETHPTITGFPPALPAPLDSADEIGYPSLPSGSPRIQYPDVHVEDLSSWISSPAQDMYPPPPPPAYNYPAPPPPPPRPHGGWPGHPPFSWRPHHLEAWTSGWQASTSWNGR